MGLCVLWDMLDVSGSGSCSAGFEVIGMGLAAYGLFVACRKDA